MYNTIYTDVYNIYIFIIQYIYTHKQHTIPIDVNICKRNYNTSPMYTWNLEVSPIGLSNLQSVLVIKRGLLTLRAVFLKGAVY